MQSKKDTTPRILGQSARKRKTPVLPRMILSAPAESPMALIFEYLLGNLSERFSSREGKRRAVDAIWAFWNTDTLIQSGASQAEIRDAGLNAIRAIQRQIQHVAGVSGLSAADFENEAEPIGIVQDGRWDALCRMVEQLAASQLRNEGNTVNPELTSGSNATATRADPVQPVEPSSSAPRQRDFVIVDDDEILGDFL